MEKGFNIVEFINSMAKLTKIGVVFTILVTDSFYIAVVMVCLSLVYYSMLIPCARLIDSLEKGV